MAKELTVSADTYRWPERLGNSLSAGLHALGLAFTNLEPDSIIASARRRTGLHDVGDPRFRDYFQLLRDELEAKGVTPLARVGSRQVVIRAVANRLKIEDYLRKHPQVLDVEVRRPIFVVGFPRTGTTVLQNLLARHPDRRALQFWELTNPVPAYDDPAEDERRRVASIDRFLWFGYKVAPEMGAVHEIHARSNEECWSLFANTFAMLNYVFQMGVHEYGGALMSSDMAWAYAEYKRMLQILLYQRPAQQLVLKCPEHLWFLDALLEVFPDACIVWPHRDPFPTVASYCSLISMSRRFYYGHLDRHELGRDISASFKVGIDRAVATRERVGPARFFDVQFDELGRDHAGVMRAIDAHFGFEPYPHWDREVEAWHAEERADKKGEHVYDAARFGLDRAQVHRDYASYIERFGVSVRDGGGRIG